MFRFFDYIYHEDSYSEYEELMKAHKDDPSTLVNEDSYKRYFKNYWRKNQLSDHYPIWLEMQIDSTDEFLIEKKSSLEAVPE